LLDAVGDTGHEVFGFPAVVETDVEFDVIANILHDLVGGFAAALQFVLYLVELLFGLHTLGRREVEVGCDKRYVAEE